MGWIFFFTAVSMAGTLIVVDRGDQDLLKINTSTTVTENFGPTSGSALTAPIRVAVHPGTGNIFVTDAKGVQQFDGKTGVLVGLFGATGVNLTTPTGLAFNPASGNLLVADQGSDDIKEFDGSSGTLVGVFGQTGDPGNLTNPIAIAFHPVTGNLFVIDGANNDVRVFDGTSGNLVSSSFGDTASDLSTPSGLGFQPATNKLMVTNGNQVRVFDGTLGTSEGSFGQTFGTLNSAFDLFFDTNTRELYVADNGNNDIRLFAANGDFTRSLGTSNINDPGGLVFIPTVPTNVFQFPRGQRVTSPYWQVDPISYTFMAVSHPSIVGMSSEIGVSFNAVQSDGLKLYGNVEFTLQAGKTQRVFITGTDSFINPGNLPNDAFIIGTNTLRLGQIVINPVASNPTAAAPGQGGGTRDVTSLAYWGAIVIRTSNVGFAMEFIGDLQDSRAFNTPNFSGIN